MVGGQSSHARAPEKRGTPERAQQTAQRIAEHTARTGLRVAGYAARTGRRIAGSTARGIMRNIDSIFYGW